MFQYPKQILDIPQQIQSYIDAEMEISSRADVEKALKTIGYYRLRGYSFQRYNNATIFHHQKTMVFIRYCWQ